jgi:hypothetical protein
MHNTAFLRRLFPYKAFFTIYVALATPHWTIFPHKVASAYPRWRLACMWTTLLQQGPLWKNRNPLQQMWDGFKPLKHEPFNMYSSHLEWTQ